MTENYKEYLDEELEAGMTALDKEWDHQKRMEILAELDKLSGLREKVDRAENESRKLETEAKENRHKKIETAIRYSLDVAGLLLPLGFYGWIYVSSITAEQNGVTPTFQMFRNFLGGFKPSIKK